MHRNKWFSFAFPSSSISALKGRMEMSFMIMSAALLVLLSVPAYSAVFNISSGDVAGLIGAINAANANGEDNTINLAAGTYVLTAVNNLDDGANGLPSVTGNLMIIGEGSGTTIIAGSPPPGLTPFRIFHVAATGHLALDGLSIQGGRVLVGFPTASGAAGIFGLGALTITNSTIGPNDGPGIGVGGTAVITNSTITGNEPGLIAEGMLTINSSTISENAGRQRGGGGIYVADGIVNVYNSTIRDNTSASVSGGGIRVDAGTMTLINSTVTANDALFNAGGIHLNGGTLSIVNSTVAGNFINPVSQGVDGIFSTNGTVLLQNTVLANNGGANRLDCGGSVTSLGHNIIGNCSITLQPSDLTGDPGLAPFIDDGAPGHGRFPLLPGSPAIDAAGDAACPITDQLSTPRRGPCDIGAVEFYPVVNDLVALGNLATAFDPTVVPGGPAGTFRITADFTNTSNQAIVHPFAEVVELTGRNLLLNADGGAGGVGARVTPPNSVTSSFEPGASSTFEFLIGLQRQEPFTFFVNMLGEPRTSNSFVSKR